MRFTDSDALAWAAAERVERAAGESVACRGFFTIALSGGRSPGGFFSVLASEPFATGFPWDRTFFFQTDERCVPPGHPDSNYGMIHDALLSRVRIPRHHIFRIRGELPPEESAHEYEMRLNSFFKDRNGIKGGFPIFDCIVLGVGIDGHTASLFPGSDALDERHRMVAPVPAPESCTPRARVTMTFPVINHAERVFLLVPGNEKRDIMRSILDPGCTERRFPVSRIKPAGEYIIMTDFDV